MFSSSKVSQSMIDAVNKVLGKEEPKPVVVETPNGRVPFAPAQPAESQTLSESGHEKVATPTGTKVYGSSYGNSKKARQDQTKSPVDALKGPKDKEMKEELKSETFEFHLTEGSYADLHKKWGDTHNIEYHSHTLYPKHTVTKFDNEKDAESHAKKTGGTVRMNVSPKMKNEELKGNQDKIDANHNNKIDGQDFKILKAKKKVKEGREFTEELLETVRKSDVPAYLRKAKGDTPLTVADVKGPKKDSISAPENLAKNRNEEVEQVEEADKLLARTGMNLPHKFPRTGQTNLGNIPGMNTPGVSKETGAYAEKRRGDRAKELKPAIKSALGTHGPKGKLPEEFEQVEEGKFNQMDVDRQDREAALEKDGWKKMPANVKDKGGNIHTPMSRARDLARSAFNKIKSDAK